MAAPDAKLNANPPGVGMICVRVSVEVKVSAGDIEVFSNFFCFKYHWSESFFFSFFLHQWISINSWERKEIKLN